MYPDFNQQAGATYTRRQSCPPRYLEDYDLSYAGYRVIEASSSLRAGALHTVDQEEDYDASRMLLPQTLQAQATPNRRELEITSPGAQNNSHRKLQLERNYERSQSKTASHSNISPDSLRRAGPVPAPRTVYRTPVPSPRTSNPCDYNYNEDLPRMQKQWEGDNISNNSFNAPLSPVHEKEDPQPSQESDALLDLMEEMVARMCEMRAQSRQARIPSYSSQPRPDSLSHLNRDALPQRTPTRQHPPLHQYCVDPNTPAPTPLPCLPHLPHQPPTQPFHQYILQPPTSTECDQLTMAEAHLCGLQDEFTCSVCLDTLTDPVAIPCGHSFCLKCLTDYWDQSQECSCPQCRHTFTIRPELNRNTLLNEVIKKLKKTTLISPPPQNYASPGDVECDFCTGKKFRAVKSCLTCMASYCQTHLQPHYEVATLKHHKLVDPDGNLKEKLCEKHQKSLEIFCKTDDSCICMMCVVTGHKNHEMVELEMEREEKQKQLGETLSDIKRKLEEREKTLKETRRVMDEMKMSVVREVEENEKSFTALIRCIEEAHRKLTERIREQEKREMEKAEVVMEQLEKEIEELKSREDELKELSETKDHLHFLQTFSSRCVLPADGDSLSFTVTADFACKDLRKELSSLTKSLEKISQRNIMTRTPSGTALLCIVNYGRPFIPANTHTPLDGAPPAAWRCPEFQQGIMDIGVFLHSPAGYHGGRKGTLQGGSKTYICPLTRKYVLVTWTEEMTCFWDEEEEFLRTRTIKDFGKSQTNELSWVEGWQRVWEWRIDY
ncbi:TRI25 ligase, partial [Polypterus senegalus]